MIVIIIIIVSCVLIGELVVVGLTCLARSARCITMSHLTAAGSSTSDVVFGVWI